MERTAEPRLKGRIVYCDADGLPYPEEGEVDVLGGVTLSLAPDDPEGDVILCEVEWIDPPTGDIAALAEEAAEALETWEVSATGY